MAWRLINYVYTARCNLSCWCNMVVSARPSSNRCIKCARGMYHLIIWYPPPKESPGHLRRLTVACWISSLPPLFESRRGHIWRAFHLWLRFITFESRSAHLAYQVDKSGRKIPTIIIVITKESPLCRMYPAWPPSRLNTITITIILIIKTQTLTITTASTTTSNQIPICDCGIFPKITYPNCYQ